MNIWVEKSIKLANSNGYLDKLFKVYPVGPESRRDVPDDIKEIIKNAFEKRDSITLIKELLKLPKFPIDDPYIASLRRHQSLLEKNPKTIERISEKLFSLGIDTVLELSSKPKTPSRQFGHAFKQWLRTFNYPFLGESEFKRNSSIAFLEGSDEELKKFAEKELGVKNLEKGIDFLLKIKENFFLGEAKFLTDYGGSQNNQFRDALKVAEIKKHNIIGIAVLDGIVWFESKAKMYKTIKEFEGFALSALLLKEFIEEQLKHG
jgi:hypothetical protein